MPIRKQYRIGCGADPRVVHQFERLPAYAPELNPIEQVWGSVKTRELANVCAPDLGALSRPLHIGLGRVRRDPELAAGFLCHAGLEF